MEPASYTNYSISSCSEHGLRTLATGQQISRMFAPRTDISGTSRTAGMSPVMALIICLNSPGPSPKQVNPPVNGDWIHATGRLSSSFVPQSFPHILGDALTCARAKSTSLECWLCVGFVWNIFTFLKAFYHISVKMWPICQFYFLYPILETPHLKHRLA